MNRLLTIALLAAVPMSFGPINIAHADDWGGAGGAADFETSYGVAYFGAEEQPIEAGTRDANGNRLIVNGRIMESSSLSGGVGDSDDPFNQSIAASSATGNQLNVITSGSFNTVIVDSTQNNSGDITATVGDH